MESAEQSQLSFCLALAEITNGLEFSFILLIIQQIFGQLLLCVKHYSSLSVLGSRSKTVDKTGKVPAVMEITAYTGKINKIDIKQVKVNKFSGNIKCYEDNTWTWSYRKSHVLLVVYKLLSKVKNKYTIWPRSFTIYVHVNQDALNIAILFLIVSNWKHRNVHQ